MSDEKINSKLEFWQMVFITRVRVGKNNKLNKSQFYAKSF